MNDNALIIILIAALQAGLTAQGFTVGIEQEYQPIQQGTPSADTVFIFKLSDNRYGFPKRADVYNSGLSIMQHTETEVIESVYQVNALATQNPANQSQLTSADYVKAASRVLQSDTLRATLFANGIGIYRIQAIKTTQFKDDRDQFQADPSFTFTVTHNDAFTETIPSTDVLVGTVYNTDNLS